MGAVGVGKQARRNYVRECWWYLTGITLCPIGAWYTQGGLIIMGLWLPSSVGPWRPRRGHCQACCNLGGKVIEPRRSYRSRQWPRNWGTSVGLVKPAWTCVGERLKVGKAVTFSSKVGSGGGGWGVVLFSGMEAVVHTQRVPPRWLSTDGSLWSHLEVWPSEA